MTSLSDFPRPNVAVDVAVLTLLPSPDPRRTPGRLAVLVQRRRDSPAGWALPGRFLREGEVVEDAIRVALRVKAGLDTGGARPRLLRVFDSPTRDPRGWTLSIAHCLAVPSATAVDPTSEFVAIDRSGALSDGRELLFDHGTIVRDAAAAVRLRYELKADPDRFLGGVFSRTDLQFAHEAVLGTRLQRDTFRRRMLPQLSPAMDADGVQLQRIARGRPANLWTSDPDDEVLAADGTRLQLPRADAPE